MALGDPLIYASIIAPMTPKINGRFWHVDSTETLRLRPRISSFQMLGETFVAETLTFGYDKKERTNRLYHAVFH